MTTSFTAENTPEYVVYKSVFPVEQVKNVAAIMADVLRPRLAEWEFRDVRNLVRHDVNQRRACKENNVLDAVRFTAFGGSGLGRSPLCPEHNINEIYPEDLAEYILQNVSGNNITVVGNVGDKNAFIDAVGHAFCEIPKEPEVKNISVPSSKYVGGQTLACDGPDSVFVQAYRGASPFTNDFVAQNILAEILGSFSKSQYSPITNGNSRLTKAFTGGNINEAKVISLPGSQSVFGIMARSDSPVADVAKSVANQLEGLKNISEQEFNAAKNVVKSKSRYFNDLRGNALESAYAKYHSGNSNGSDVTLEDVQRVANEILSSPSTTYASGDLTGMN